MKYAFFPGCTMSYRLPFVEKSVRMISPHFGIDLVDLPFTCCPEPNSVHSFSEQTWITLAARNIAVAEKEELSILTACAGCFETLAVAKHELDSNPTLKTSVNETLAKVGMKYKGTSEVRHMHQVLFETVGLEEISEKVVNPLSMRVVAHPGCHILRPEKILQVDNAEAPTKLDDLVRVLGIEPLEYMDKTMCCGAGIRGSHSEVAYAVLRDKMASMMMVEPDAAVVFCPTCFLSFEAGQKIVNRTFGTDYNLPVFYYTELLALAMNLPDTEPLLAGHRVKPKIALQTNRGSSEEEEIERTA
ncbi:MAG: CoB--CoM heterodisulfide reductase iron-sulfur subunit B family protein [Candidatus Thorarchaeota archaeon]|jgi:heterodisulfide reductase subunit B